MIKFKEILSTTFKKEKALQFATNALFTITVKKHLEDKNNWRVLNAKNAVFVENITAVKGEEEVIFPSGTEFIIEDINEHKMLKLIFGDEKFKIINIKITIPLYVKYW